MSGNKLNIYDKSTVKISFFEKNNLLHIKFESNLQATARLVVTDVNERSDAGRIKNIGIFFSICQGFS